ncbi:MAG: hypothetical protein COW00_08320 [Bdellovibrio sp. CG12_big_fil_rev_8_21_14_0_65_39_13]|nr:MAG: hypothetical protein COW78_19675 [Bdellovibrio sp. CG22_combo_CG10-13_8_21_14_all_39_27]PIQ59922.1 MAG: hypothetical protein COW00_08320 [Bdellovibrio sp. CG12_big_fil_rev_8_21_14_0_65_39_13]PIR34436.1 MAG: hypothetical protein COV37_12975 [Bdellovibrio sp. CG11_big_fil_rev_8_21_14_0_20_39_38]PJB53860.1 MAG: hypothetical protein CO099_04795 [Bdellovibrio sp. CG_4_9_14_3_um_filter_39_7]
MSMKAQVRTDSMGNITVHIEGGLDFDNSLPLKNELQNLAQENPASQITIDLHGLDFVGSSGIGFFVETIKILNQKKEQFKLSNVKSEFLKVFKLYDNDLMSLIEQEFDTDETDDLGQRFANRKRTYQN